MVNDKIMNEMKVPTEMGVAAGTKPDIPASPGPRIVFFGGSEAFMQRLQRALEDSARSIFGESCTWEFIPVRTAKVFTDEDYDKMESGGMLTSQIDEGHEAVSSCWRKNKFVEYVEYANDYIEKIAKPKTGILFSGATMQNIYQLVTSGMVTTGKGKTLLKLNEAAFMMLLYGLVMPRRAAGHVALAIGVALASAAYLVTMSFAF